MGMHYEKISKLNDISSENAIEYYLQAANYGHDGAMYRIGRLYLQGQGISKDISQAKLWLEKAAKYGNIEAKGLLTQMDSTINQNNMSSVEKMFSKGYSYDKAPSQEMYNKGLACEQVLNYAEAMKYYREAADSGNVDAMLAMGRLYHSSSNTSEAVKWYRLAADAGNAEAKKAIEELRRKLSPQEMYHKGRKEESARNYDEALKWYRQAADAGDAESMYRIGELCADGHNAYCYNFIGYNSGEWYYKAAEAGHVEAMCHIGVIYADEEQNYTESMKWFCKAAEAGHAYAMYRIGKLYEHGRSVAKDYTESIKWYRKAVNAGYKSAESALVQVQDIVKKEQDIMQESQESNKKRLLNEQQERKKTGRCFITTAVCDSFNKPDNCYELTMFRDFRDNWLVLQSDGQFLINEYYRIAPFIVENINLCSDAQEIYQEILNQYLKPCLSHIESGDNLRCKELYVSMVKNLRKRFAPEHQND